MDKLEQLVGETLRDAARAAPAPRGVERPAPQRRGERWAVLAAAAAVAAVIAGTVMITGIGSDLPAGETDPAPLAAAGRGSERQQPDPTAPAKNLVGFGDVVMELPPSWTMSDYDCGVPQTDTVGIQLPSAVLMCLTTRPAGVSDIRLDDLDSGLAHQWRDVATEQVTLRDGTPALTGTTSSPIDGHTTRVLVIPKLDAILVGTPGAPGELDDVMMSPMQRPEGVVAVPSLYGQTAEGAEDRLREAGLQVVFEFVAHPDHGLVANTRPQPWTVVPTGSTVVVQIAR